MDHDPYDPYMNESIWTEKKFNSIQIIFSSFIILVCLLMTIFADEKRRFYNENTGYFACSIVFTPRLSLTKSFVILNKNIHCVSKTLLFVN